MAYKDPEKKRQKNKENYKANKEKYKLSSRRAHLKRKYGITVEEYDLMLKSQNGMCAICGTTEPNNSGRPFSVDHCHETGAVRALLCTHCNTGLGGFKDNTASLLRAVDYLNKHRQADNGPN